MTEGVRKAVVVCCADVAFSREKGGAAAKKVARASDTRSTATKEVKGVVVKVRQPREEVGAML